MEVREWEDIIKKKKKIGEKYFFNKVENNWRVTVAFRNCEEREERLLEHYFYDLVLHMWRIDEFTRAVGVTLGDHNLEFGNGDNCDYLILYLLRNWKNHTSACIVLV